VLLYAVVIVRCYAFLPQHFLYLRPLPQTHGSLRPTFGVALVTGLCGGGQQLVLVQVDSFASENWLLSFMLITNSLKYKLLAVIINVTLH